MTGQVYCFNCSNETMRALMVDGAPAGSIEGWASQGPDQYRPRSLAVPRTRNADSQTASFPADAETQVRIEWDSLGVAASIMAGDPGVSLDDDLILFVAVSQLVLMDTRGYVLQTVACRPLSVGMGSN